MAKDAIAAVRIDRRRLAEFCRRHNISKLALFGSILRDNFGPESDVDVLVEFKSGSPVGFITLTGIERKLSQLVGRKVDLRTPAELSPYFRQEVVDRAEVLYA